VTHHLEGNIAMGEMEMRAAGEQILTQARAMLAAYPDAVAMPISPPLADGTAWPTMAAALRRLRDEMVLVRTGTAGGVVVLADEIACVERELARR
jgi:hypothetical protein